MTLDEMIVHTLQSQPAQSFTARALAAQLVADYPQKWHNKRQSFASEAQLIRQVAAEISSRTARLKQHFPAIGIRDKPQPRLYFWLDVADTATAPTPMLSEAALYPLLMEFLYQNLGLYCQRIDEKTSSNRHGGANQWLHPDMVALEILDRHWHSEVKTAAALSGGGRVRLWSFEVKKHLTSANVRRSFFQAVSNSAWAHLGYLAAASLERAAEQELHMLCALHGIGLLLLNTDCPTDSEILIPARLRSEADWLSVDRLVKENKDFQHYIEQVGIYLQSGKVVPAAWYRAD